MLEMPATLDAVVKDIESVQGSAYVVGGAVIDAIQ